jgi:putative transposase
VSAYIDACRGRFGVEPICSVLGVSASAYYHRKTGARSQRVVEDERLLVRIRELHLANYEAYGSRKTWLALHRAGVEVGRDHVARLMRDAGIRGAKGRTKRWQTTQPELVRRLPDLVERRFEAAGVVFLSFVLDVWSRRVVGWQFASHMRTTLVLDALRMALAGRRSGADVELVHHSDRGSQYLSYDYTQVLADHGVLASCGSVGDAYDNALAESFVDTIKTELIRDRVWRTQSQLELAIVAYIGWYNHDRLHEALDDMPPAEYEALALTATLQD